MTTCWMGIPRGPYAQGTRWGGAHRRVSSRWGGVGSPLRFTAPGFNSCAWFRLLKPKCDKPISSFALNGLNVCPYCKPLLAKPGRVQVTSCCYSPDGGMVAGRGAPPTSAEQRILSRFVTRFVSVLSPYHRFVADTSAQLIPRKIIMLRSKKCG